MDGNGQTYPDTQQQTAHFRTTMSFTYSINQKHKIRRIKLFYQTLKKIHNHKNKETQPICFNKKKFEHHMQNKLLTTNDSKERNFHDKRVENRTMRTSEL